MVKFKISLRKLFTQLSSVLVPMSLLCLSKLVFATSMAQFPQWQTNHMPGKPSLRGSAIKGSSLWVTGSNNGVYVSQDGGQSWHDKSVTFARKTDFRDIELFDKNTAIVMGVGTGEQSMLFKTKDGGNSWQLLYQNTDKEGFFDSIAFWDKHNGLLLGDPVDGYYVVKKTEDGGKTWRRISPSKLPKTQPKEAAFAASGNTLIVGENGKAWLTTGGFSASVYVSNDYGESWQRHAVPLYNETATAGGYGLALNHLAQPFVLGGDYQQRPAKYANMATFNAGQWQSVNAGERGLRTAMNCQGNICIATGKTSSDISFNAGKSWQPFMSGSMAKTELGFYTLAADDFIFLAAGAEGMVGVLSFKR